VSAQRALRSRRERPRALLSLSSEENRARTHDCTRLGCGRGILRPHRDGGGLARGGGPVVASRRPCCSDAHSGKPPDHLGRRALRPLHAEDSAPSPEVPDLRAVTTRPRPCMVADHRSSRGRRHSRGGGTSNDPLAPVLFPRASASGRPDLDHLPRAFLRVPRCAQSRHHGREPAHCRRRWTRTRAPHRLHASRLCAVPPRGGSAPYLARQGCGRRLDLENGSKNWKGLG
jgi:hypothetical protein